MGVEAAMRYLFSPRGLVASCWAPASGCFPDSEPHGSACLLWGRQSVVPGPDRFYWGQTGL